MIKEDLKVLGKVVTYQSKYDPTLLDKELRQDNRTIYNIEEDNLPFIGYDTWNAYEVSTLTNNSLPINVVLKITYSCTSQYIVESKSIKLYLMSFNFEKLGNNREEVCKELIRRVSSELSSLLETVVDVSIPKESILLDTQLFDIYTELGSEVNLEGIQFEEFEENPKILKISEGETNISLTSDLLRSNCKVTGQPDFGDVYIHISSNKYKLDLESLAKYIVSFRKENHFHEEICECIYKRLYELLQPEKLLVCCLYTRRGGIDINPVRANSLELLEEECLDLILKDRRVEKTRRQ